MRKLIVALIVTMLLSISVAAPALADGVIVINPGTTVVAPCEAEGGAVTAFSNVSASPAIDSIPIMSGGINCP